MVSAADVMESKPHPEVFLEAAKRLGAKPSACLVFEDSPKGVEAAANAGMECIVVTTMHNASDFSAYKNVRQFIRDFSDPQLVSDLLGTNWI